MALDLPGRGSAAPWCVVKLLACAHKDNTTQTPPYAHTKRTHTRTARAANLVAKTTQEAAASGKPLAPNPLLLGMEPEAYMLRAVRAVRPADVEQALLLLPFPDALRLLGHLSGWLAAGADVELCVRVATLLLRIHQAPLAATPAAREPLLALQRNMRSAVGGLRDCVGYNAAALAYLKRAARERQAMRLDGSESGERRLVKRLAPSAELEA